MVEKWEGERLDYPLDLEAELLVANVFRPNSACIQLLVTNSHLKGNMSFYSWVSRNLWGPKPSANESG